MIGMRVGRLVVLEYVGRDKHNVPLLKCQCDCGKVKNIPKYGLLSKKPTKSCGCIKKEMLAKRNKESGVWKGETTKPEYRRIYQIWRGMLHRCEFPTDVNYHIYGGKGIKICDEWHDWRVFRDWAFANGYRDDLTIDRIDSDGNYEPSNCRWTTPQIQANNTSRNKMLPYKGRTQSLADWCRELNLDYDRTKARLNDCGYTVEQAFELSKYPAQNLNGNKRLGKFN